MAFTNAWDETTPTGSDNASTTDDFFRKHRLDLGERLEDMFMGFNAASNATPENNIGVKFLKCYKQDSDPSTVVDFGHVYVKLVSGIPELFFQDDTNTTLQLTSGGKLKSTAGLVVDGASTLTGAVTMSSTATIATSLDIASTVVVVGTIDDDTMATATDTTLATSESITAYTDAAQAAATETALSSGGLTGTLGSATTSFSSVITHPGGMIELIGYNQQVGSAKTIDISGASFTGIYTCIITSYDTQANATRFIYLNALTLTTLTYDAGSVAESSLEGVFYHVIGY